MQFLYTLQIFLSDAKLVRYSTHTLLVLYIVCKYLTVCRDCDALLDVILYSYKLAYKKHASQLIKVWKQNIRISCRRVHGRAIETSLNCIDSALSLLYLSYPCIDFNAVIHLMPRLEYPAARSSSQMPTRCRLDGCI